MSGHPPRLLDTGPLDDGAPQLFLDPTESLQAVTVWTNRRTKVDSISFSELYSSSYWTNTTTVVTRLTNMHACTCWQTHTHTHKAGPAQYLVSWAIASLWGRFTAEAAANDFQHQHQHRELCSCDLQPQLHGSMTGNKRPWKIQCNDYGEEKYCYISEWDMLPSCSSLSASGQARSWSKLCSKSPFSLGLCGMPLSSKSSIQHFQASLTKTGLKESSVTSVEQRSPILRECRWLYLSY